MTRLAKAWLLFGAAGVLSSFAEPASAFERQWHVGGGLGIASESGGYDLGPVLGIHGAYGISDVFDARLELQGSRNDLAGLPVSFYGARAGLAYKIDVIQWIPYVGASGGAFALAWSEGWFVRPSAGGFAGLDYALSRHLGIGVYGALDYIFASADPNLIVGTGLVRAEYRFGW